MKENTSIKLKAAFLIVVFSMNTVIGFACAMGIGMGFNSKHQHGEEEAMETTVHPHNQVPEHEEHNGSPHSHGNSEKDRCCNHSFIQFQGLDKSLVDNSNAINLPVFVAIIQHFQNTPDFKYAQVSAQKYPLPFFHPPPPDIRILIQCFQI